MIIGFLIFGFGWSLILKARSKTISNFPEDMPFGFLSPAVQKNLFWATIIASFIHLVLGILLFNWIGVLYWLLSAIITQIIGAVIFSNSITKNPAPPFFAGILAILIGTLIILSVVI